MMVPEDNPYYKFESKFECTLAGNPASNCFTLLQVSDVNDRINIFSNKGWEKGPSSPWSKPLLAYNRKGNTAYMLLWGDSAASLQIQCWDVSSDKATKVITTFNFGDSFDYAQGQQVLNGVSSSVGLFSSFIKQWPAYYGDTLHLVAGEEFGRPDPVLFLVVRHLTKAEETEANGPPTKAKMIHLFRIDLERGKVEYVKSLGEQALFVGSNSDPFILSTRACPELKSNSIYIADELGVHDLETKCVTPLLSLGDLATIRPQAYWVAPPSFG